MPFLYYVLFTLQVTECYIQIGDWKGTEEWMILLKRYRHHWSGNEIANWYQHQRDLNYIRALMSFDQQDVVQAQDWLARTTPIESVTIYISIYLKYL